MKFKVETEQEILIRNYLKIIYSFTRLLIVHQHVQHTL